MFNCIAGILGSQSCKTDWSSWDGYAESLWNTTSFPVSLEEGEEGEITGFHFMEGEPIYPKAGEKSQHKGKKQFQVQILGFPFYH